MGHRRSGRERRHRGAERARGVALDDQQIDAGEPARNRRGDAFGMVIGVGLAGAVEVLRAIMPEPELGWIEARMLAGEDQSRRKSARC